MFRAEESERADAVFRDPYARRLAGERGEQIASAIEFGRANSWSFVARTYLFDASIERHVAEGFDTTRISVPVSIPGRTEWRCARQ